VSVQYLTDILLGLGVAYIGLLPPGMMNMTVVHKTITSGMKESMQFALGAVFIIGIQCLIALTFSKMLSNDPSIISSFRRAAIFVFLGLSILFYMKSRQKVRQGSTDNRKTSVLAGMGMSGMNMLAIPFFFGFSAYLEIQNMLELSQPHISFFVLGAVLGAFLLFYTYGRFAVFISRRVGFIARNINLILSVFFILLALIATIQVWHAQ
jgi:threonine/homoserine/homoserine lactone efflux protein